MRPVAAPHVCRTLFASLLALVLCSAASAGVVITPWGPSTITYFPPGSPPPDLDDEDDADARPWMDSSCDTLDGHWNNGDSIFRVDTLGTVTASGYAKIRLPNGASGDLAEHENGHARLFGWEYADNAKKKFEDALRGFVGMTFTGEGADSTQRKQDARRKAREELNRRCDRAIDAIVEQMEQVSGAFDDFTDHGRSETCTTAQGEQKAKEDHFLAPPAGMIPKVPDPGRPWCRATGAGEYDPIDQVIRIGGSLEILETQSPGDPLLPDAIWVYPDPILLIGPQENGTIHLADTHVQIRHPVTGDTLLNGYLLEPAFMPSNIAGFASMIQGHLQLLPAWAGGFHNPMASPFLAGMEIADLANEQSTMWIAFPVPVGEPDLWTEPWTLPASVIVGVAPPGPIGVGPAVATGATGLAIHPLPSRGALHFAWTPIASEVDLEIVDVSGARRWSGRVEGARGRWTWPGLDANGTRLPAGIYFARLTGPGTDLRARIVLLP